MTSTPRLSRNSSVLDQWDQASTDTPYPSYISSRSHLSIISQKYSLSADPHEWGSDLTPELKEADDDLHTPEKGPKQIEREGHALSMRGLQNIGCLAVLVMGILALFAGYPIISYATRETLRTNGGFNIGGLNASGQVPSMSGNFGLVDLDTPQDAYTKPSLRDGRNMQLVFSDEFNMDGRTFYPGDDPYWEAQDIHYWGTNNLEWYDPAAITTSGGNLVITLSQKNPSSNHNLSYQGGMMTTWNKFCFTGGYIETSVVLPGASNVMGLWPAIWTLGNLGRAGYGASLEGMWPYTYDSCDVGTLANQTLNGLPVAATVNGDEGKGGVLSYLPGQRLSRCTCDGETHPGPKHSDGTYVGRAAPEIDIFEAQINSETLEGEVSQSGQFAPFDARYQWKNTSDNMVVADPSLSHLNGFMGNVLQQATSVVTTTNQNCYQLTGGCFSVYGFEYKAGFDDAYITWISDNKLAWSINAAGVGANDETQVGARPIPQEPMYIIANLGMSENFGTVDLAHLTFPARMLVDYIRVYQPEDAINIGCDPPDFPTQAYIEQFIEAYTNPNLTTFVDDYHQTFPKNSLIDQC